MPLTIHTQQNIPLSLIIDNRFSHTAHTLYLTQLLSLLILAKLTLLTLIPPTISKGNNTERNVYNWYYSRRNTIVRCEAPSRAHWPVAPSICVPPNFMGFLAAPTHAFMHLLTRLEILFGERSIVYVDCTVPGIQTTRLFLPAKYESVFYSTHNTATPPPPRDWKKKCIRSSEWVSACMHEQYLCRIPTIRNRYCAA